MMVSVTGTDPEGAVAADFDNDGTLDLVIGDGAGPSVFLRGLGGGAFGPEQLVHPETFPSLYEVDAADLDGDHNLDLVFVIYGLPDRLYRGDGHGNFTFVAEVETTAGYGCVNCLQVQDVNHDDIADLIIGYNTGTDRVLVFPGRGDLTFAPPFSVPYGTLTPISVKVADLNGDDNLDLVVGRSLGGGVWTSLGDGHGAFTDLTPLATTTVARCDGLGTNDFDGDGNVDLVFSQDAPGVVGFLRGIGGGAFGPQTDLDGGMTYTGRDIDVGDLDGDGLLDFVMSVDAPGMGQFFLGR
jgi:hypothetical protein